ncbi:hypothetical protein N7468_000981 [Penicillium chermesinum]|uniref:Scaffold protein Nfu/NifU N-terminal domain-containing protein n=1 Tax=Penicillium chermesinum TaxID=63820 RepID=A0A9W9PHY9_9EURO|nr:uncharacterized protein N7468_000981 [Penicillium chermesinum]KAJ5245998.1 hypothetical protein N7468_000981 [Penicillium chermesinum]
MSISSTSTSVLRRAVSSGRLASPISQAIRPALFSSFRTVSSASRLPTLTASETHRRPTIRPNERSLAQANALSPTSKRTIFIQTENTPNPDALKFIPNHRVLPEDFSTPFLEYLSPRSTIAPPHPSPLAAKLFDVEGVTSIFYGADFITVTKAADANWAHIKPEIFSLITQAVTSGETIVSVVENAHAEAGQEGEVDSLAYSEDDDEVVGMIKEILETRIRPAIQEDGGDIEFRGFEDGIVMLKLRGACRTCDSSTVTLKNGIESMLMHYIEEVKGVEQVMDQEETISMHEFARFEEKLRQQKGAAATASSPIDAAP